MPASPRKSADLCRSLAPGLTRCLVKLRPHACASAVGQMSRACILQAFRRAVYWRALHGAAAAARHAATLALFKTQRTRYEVVALPRSFGVVSVLLCCHGVRLGRRCAGICCVRRLEYNRRGRRYAIVDLSPAPRVESAPSSCRVGPVGAVHREAVRAERRSTSRRFVVSFRNEIL